MHISKKNKIYVKKHKIKENDRQTVGYGGNMAKEKEKPVGQRLAKMDDNSLIKEIRRDPLGTFKKLHEEGVHVSERLQMIGVMKCGEVIRYIEDPSETVKMTAILKDPDSEKYIRPLPESAMNYLYTRGRVAFADSRIVRRVSFREMPKKTRDGWKPVESGRTVTVYEYEVPVLGNLVLKPVMPLFQNGVLTVYAGKQGFVDALANGSVAKYLDTNVVLIGRDGKVTVYDNGDDSAYYARLDAQEKFLRNGRIKSANDFANMVAYLDSRIRNRNIPVHDICNGGMKKAVLKSIKKCPDFPSINAGDM